MNVFVVLLVAASASLKLKHRTRIPVTAAERARGGPRCADLQDEIQDTEKLLGGMGARVTMLRFDAGNIQAFNRRDALQVDADLWQSLIDQMKARNQKRRELVERCDARAKIAAAAESKGESRAAEEVRMVTRQNSDLGG
jgi:hypothetical protein